jgi:hypothetical protein
VVIKESTLVESICAFEIKEKNKKADRKLNLIKKDTRRIGLLRINMDFSQLLSRIVEAQECDPAHFTQGHPAGQAARDDDSSNADDSISYKFTFPAQKWIEKVKCNNLEQNFKQVL